MCACFCVCVGVYLVVLFCLFFECVGFPLWVDDEEQPQFLGSIVFLLFRRGGSDEWNSACGTRAINNHSHTRCVEIMVAHDKKNKIETFDFIKRNFRIKCER